MDQAERDEQVVQAIGDLFIAYGVDPSYRPHRVLIIAEALSESGKQTLLTLTTTMPAWTTMGMLEAAQIQTRQLMAGEGE